MQTYSHFIITAALKRFAKKRSLNLDPPLDGKAILWGSIMPDLPLTLVAIYTIIYNWVSRGETKLTQWLFDTAFFEEKWVKVIHNLFHGPLMVLAYLGVGWVFWKKSQARWARFLFWLAVGAGIHTLIDIPLHYNDGPLLLFPFNFDFRFYSPVSYWDPAHYGRIAAPLEHLLVLGILIWLLIDWRKAKAAQ